MKAIALFGVFHLVTGLTTLLASLIAGGLWSWIGPSGTFLGGALFTTLGLVGVVALGRRLARGRLTEPRRRA